MKNFLTSMLGSLAALAIFAVGAGVLFLGFAVRLLLTDRKFA